MNLVFCGTPQFAVPTLNALIAAGHRLELVVTQPDRPSGRGKQLAISAVKQSALKLQLPLAQPVKLKNNPAFQFQLQEISPEAIIVVAYGRIIPSWMLALPSFGGFNVHASLLPKYRGAAPIQWAIARGESITGVTIMQLDEGLDTGPILLQKEIQVANEDTAVSLSTRLADLGSTLMVKALHQVATGAIKSLPQDHSQATLAPLLKKEDGRIDFSQPASEIYNRLRGFQPWPGVYTSFRGRHLEIGAARVAQPVFPVAPATIFVEDNRLFFGCGAGTALEVLEVHPEGKKRMSAGEFQRGYRPENDEVLGSSVNKP
jgi:methionyl-tRNA formyltransferase